MNFNNITLKIQIFFHCSPWENLLMYPDNLLTDQILYSPNLDACRCIGILRRSYILTPYKNIRMQNLLHVSCICVIQNLLRVCTHLLSSRDEGKANLFRKKNKIHVSKCIALSLATINYENVPSSFFRFV